MQTFQPTPKQYKPDIDVADRFCVTRQTVWNWLRNDPTFPRPVRLSARCTRWDMDEIEAWAKARSVAA